MKKPPKPLTSREVFSRNLRRARRLREMSQEELALEAGVTRAYLSSVELGKRNISIDNLGLLANAVGVPLRDLVDPEKFKGLDDV
jgi:transcriptional regulator with XRE-family HTH domain